MMNPPKPYVKCFEDTTPITRPQGNQMPPSATSKTAQIRLKISAVNRRLCLTLRPSPRDDRGGLREWCRLSGSRATYIEPAPPGRGPDSSAVARIIGDSPKGAPWGDIDRHFKDALRSTPLSLGGMLRPC